jgi:L-amino acid ligase C-terminal domain 2
MMIPIPRAGLLREISGVEDAADIEGVQGVEISAKLNYPITPLPEGSSYLGFIFAKGDSPEAVEHSLRLAHEKLHFRIAPMISMGVS